MENKDIEFWRNKANKFEWLFTKQKEITNGFQKLCDEYRTLLGSDRKDMDKLSGM